MGLLRVVTRLGKRLNDMTFLEMMPVIVALLLRGNIIEDKKKVIMWIDNEALVEVLNKQSSE